MIGSRLHAALGLLRLPPGVCTPQKDKESPAAAAAATPTLEQLLCIPKGDAERLLQQLLLQLQQGDEACTKQQQLLQQHLDAAHVALVELETSIYTLQQNQQQLCEVLPAAAPAPVAAAFAAVAAMLRISYWDCCCCCCCCC